MIVIIIIIFIVILRCALQIRLALSYLSAGIKGVCAFTGFTQPTLTLNLLCVEGWP